MNNKSKDMEEMSHDELLKTNGGNVALILAREIKMHGTIGLIAFRVSVQNLLRR